jgi:hypothetical protein
MRRGFDGLALQVQETLKHDPHSGHVFVFRGRRGIAFSELHFRQVLPSRTLKKKAETHPYYPGLQSLNAWDRRSLSMTKRKRLPSQTFTRLHARITEENGAFTVSVRLLNHRMQGDGAWGEEIAPSIDMASTMIDAIAKQFSISQKCVSIRIVMDDFRDGTFH